MHDDLMSVFGHDISGHLGDLLVNSAMFPVAPEPVSRGTFLFDEFYFDGTPKNLNGPLCPALTPLFTGAKIPAMTYYVNRDFSHMAGKLAIRWCDVQLHRGGDSFGNPQHLNGELLTIRYDDADYTFRVPLLRDYDSDIIIPIVDTQQSSEYWSNGRPPAYAEEIAQVHLWVVNHSKHHTRHECAYISRWCGFTAGDTQVYKVFADDHYGEQLIATIIDNAFSKSEFIPNLIPAVHYRNILGFQRGEAMEIEEPAYYAEALRYIQLQQKLEPLKVSLEEAELRKKNLALKLSDMIPNSAGKGIADDPDDPLNREIYVQRKEKTGTPRISAAKVWEFFPEYAAETVLTKTVPGGTVRICYDSES